MCAKKAITKKPFGKTWSPVAAILPQLQARGLVIANQTVAEDFLNHVGYYRFSGYCLAFESSRHVFAPGATFDAIIAAYRFDHDLRDLLLAGLEAFEVDVRAAIANELGQHFGPFGHVNPAHFDPPAGHTAWLAQLDRTVEKARELFVVHFKKTYIEYPRVPTWFAAEVLSFGSVSMMYGLLKGQYQSPVASRYGHQRTHFASILHHMSYVRNLCAHHSRVWDRNLSIPPALPTHIPQWQPPHIPDSSRIWVSVLLLYRLLQQIPGHGAFAKQWRRDVHSLLANDLPTAPNALTKMGMPSNWSAHPYFV